MKLRFYFLFVFFTLLFMFYPGDSYYLGFFAHNRDLFAQGATDSILKTPPPAPIPYLKLPEYLPQVSAQGVYVVDLNSFTPFYEKNAHERFFPASTEKIITALVAADIYKPTDIITVPRIRSVGQVMGLVEGERMTVENLLYGLLVYSGNDAAYVLAQNAGYDNFINLMNIKALTLQMKNSRFTNPTGLDDLGNYTSPFDLALAARELLENPLLTKIVSTKEITVADADFKYFHKLTNINRLLGEIQGLRGLKTGQTEFAGENLVSYYVSGPHKFIIVVVKSQDRFADTRAIINWINTNVDYLNASY